MVCTSLTISEVCIPNIFLLRTDMKLMKIVIMQMIQASVVLHIPQFAGTEILKGLLIDSSLLVYDAV